jgi:hypothetical protein
MQSANIAAWAANSAKPSAKNINSVLMAIPRQQFVALQSEYLFHDGVPSPATASLSKTAMAIRDSHHVLEVFGSLERKGVAGRVERRALS